MEAVDAVRVVGISDSPFPERDDRLDVWLISVEADLLSRSQLPLGNGTHGSGSLYDDLVELTDTVEALSAKLMNGRFGAVSEALCLRAMGISPSVFKADERTGTLSLSATLREAALTLGFPGKVMCILMLLG